MGALGHMGAMNILGTLVSGYLCDRFGKKVPLACFYFFRGVSILYLIAVDTPLLRSCPTGRRRSARR